MADQGDIQFQFTAQIDQLTSALGDAQSSMESAFKSMEDRATAAGDKLNLAFEFAGLYAAVEVVRMVGDEVEHLGERATEIRNMAEVLQLTTDQFQALSVAADAAGVSSQMLMRGVVRLEGVFAEARAGSTAAKEKLFELGFTLEEVSDKSFTANDALQVLHDRLNDASIASETITALTKEFGARAALVAEALKAYDASAQGVAEVTSRLNALDKDQIEQLHGMSVFWKELGTAVANTASKMLVFANEALHARGGLSELEDSMLETRETAQDVTPTKAVTDYAAAWKLIQGNVREVQQATLETMKTEVTAARAGSTERLDGLRAYRDELISVYGENDAKVKATGTLIATAERELADKRTAFLDEWAAYYAHTTVRNITTLEEFNAKVDKAQAADLRKIQEFLDAWADYYQHTVIRNITATEAEGIKIAKAQEQLTKTLQHDWENLGRHISNALTGAFRQMMAGTFTFAGLMKGLVTQIGESLIQTWVKGEVRFIAAEQAKAAAAKESGAQQATAATDASQQGLAVGGAAALKKVINDAYQAASGAYQAVVGIPYAGPILAPIAAGVAFAAVAGYESGIVSAAGGWEVPRDTLAMVHKDEKILPANTSKGLDNLIKTGGSAALHAHVHVTAIDTQSGTQFIMQNMRTIASGLAREMARFNPAVRRSGA